MPEGRVLTLSCSEKRLECLVRIELKVGDSDAGVSRGEGNDPSAPRGGEHRCAANALL